MKKEGTATKKVSLFNRFLNGVERTGNKLPHPMALFALMALFVIVLSGVLSMIGFSEVGDLVNRETGTIENQLIEVESLFNTDGIVYILTHAISNFTGFAPLGTVLVAMLGVGVAETSGWIGALLKKTVQVTPSKLITPVVVFLGVMSNIAGDAGYVVLIPIGGLMFLAYGRHPVAGIAAAFAGVSGGFSANLLIGTLDPLLAGITNEAIKIIDPVYEIQPIGNWFFMSVSTFLITIVGTLVTNKVIEPRLGEYHRTGDVLDFSDNTLTPVEEKALKKANLVLLAMVVGMILLLIPSDSFLRHPETGSIIAKSPFMKGIVLLIMIYFLVPAAVYGKASGNFKSHRDLCAAMGKSMATMSSFIALIFVTAQFIDFFKHTQIGTIIALKGAKFFESSGIGPIPMMLLFVFFSAFCNLFMGSASAKWTFLAPVFIPMFMLLGFSPELIQVAYRIGDSCTNLITPMMSMFPTIVIFTRRYDEKAGMGTLISLMLPYTIFFLLSWSAMLVVWMLLGLPVGPGAPLMLP